MVRTWSRGSALSAVGALALLAGCGEANPPAAEPVANAPAAVSTVAEDADAAFRDLAARHAAALLSEAPELSTELGVDPAIAGPGYLSRLGGYGFEAQESARRMNETFLQEIRAVDRRTLGPDAALSYDVLRDAYETAARRNSFGFGGASAAGAGLPNSGASWATTPYFVTQLTGPHLYIPRMLQAEHPMRSRDDAEAFLARLADIARAIDETIETVASDAAAGVAPPRFILDGAINTTTAFRAPPPADNPLVDTLRKKLAPLGDMTDEEKSNAVARATAIIETAVYPAYERLAAELERLKAQTDNEAGVWRLGEEGEAFYQMALDSYGAQGKTGDEIHEIGLSEVARISDEMDRILKSIGLANGSVGARMQELAARPDNLYPNTDEGREALLESLRGYVGAFMAAAPGWFRALPEQGLEVRRIPVYEQDSSPGGYYSGPSLDGSRPGVYWINLKDTADNPKHGLKTLTYHEGAPGHHFSIAFQRALPDAPLMRSILGYSEYDEGWALYGEKLAAEMGMYADDPEGDLGRLQAELFRAARLVVDTGLHVKRWSREDAIDYMVAATGDSRTAITREVERYAAVPGQACAYKLGMLAIEAMRARAEAELGSAFDLKDFHHEVLTAGSAPMKVLSARIDRWIAARRAD